MRAIVATALPGSRPMALSPESMRALEPSNTALAMSEASARVGDGLVIIDSSIWVAVIAGRPRVMHRSRIRFCRWGSSSIGISAPRSPRATMIAPEASMIPSRLSTAARVSIFATTIGPRGCGSTPTRRTSCAERTNDTATMSTPTSTNASSMRRSSLVGEARRSRSDGMCTPGRPCSTPPWVTRISRASACAVDHLGHGGAVAERDAVPAVQVVQQALVVDRDGAVARRLVVAGPQAAAARPARSAGPRRASCPARTLGPGRSTMMPIGF